MKREMVVLPDQARGARDDPFSLAKPSDGRNYVIGDDLRAAGYYEAEPGATGHRNWPKMHKWCLEQFEDRYTWAGASFFFLNKQDQVLFAMRWS